MISFFTAIILIYLLIIAFMYFNQRNLLYHPSENNYTNDTIEFTFEEVSIPTPTGIKIKGWFHKKDLNQKKTLVFFHGNAGDLSNRIHKLNLIKNFDINFLIVAYRGFSGNEGKPTEKGLYEDAKSTLNWLSKKKITDDKIIIYGESLGTGVSIEVTQNKRYAGLILESPFTSMVDAAKFYYPYLPVSLILKDKYESLKKLKNIKIPILVIHGKKDRIVPFKMGKVVFERANEPKYSYFPEDDDHMMEYNENLLKILNKFFNSI